MLVIPLAVAAAAVGLLATTPVGEVVVIGLLLCVGAAGALRQFGVGFALGVLVLGSVDSLPGPNLELTRLPIGLYGTDAIVLALLAVLVGINSRTGFITLRWSPVGRAVTVWSVAMITWWGFTLGRTVVGGGDPSLASAAYFGHDFLYFALLVPLMIEPLRRPRIRASMLGTLAIGSCVIAIVQIAANFGHPVLVLLHESSQTLQSGAILRVYTASTYVLTVVLPLGIAYLLATAQRRARIAAGFVTALVGVALALSLTRALYVGMVAGIAVSVAVWGLLADPVARLTKRRLIRTAIVVATFAIALASYEPAVFANSAVNGVTQRVTSIFSTANSSDTTTSTVAVRRAADEDLGQLLGAHWAIGLGFLNPKQHYVPELPQGSIRDSDTGVLNVVMTMGVIGAMLLYLPVVGALVLVISSRLKQRGPSIEREWLMFGSLAWLAMVLISSATLVVLFSTPGLVVTAFMIGLAVSITSPGLVDSARSRDRTAFVGPPVARVR